jgi:hypothetical protein
MDFKACLYGIDPQASMMMALGCPQLDDPPAAMPRVKSGIFNSEGRAEQLELLQSRRRIACAARGL